MKIGKYLGEHWVDLTGGAIIVTALLAAPETLYRERARTEFLLSDIGSYTEPQRIYEINPRFMSALENDEMIMFKFSKKGDFDRLTVRTMAGEFYGKPGEITAGLSKEEFSAYVNNQPVSIHIKEEIKTKDDSYKEIDSYGGIIK